MKESLCKINVGIDLADSELISYSYSSEDCKLLFDIKSWNGRLLKITFFDIICFTDNGYHSTLMFCKNSKMTELMRKTLINHYEIVPQTHPYSLFQFLDYDDEPCMEIICEKIEYSLFD